MKHWPFKVIQGEGGRPKIQVEVKGETKTFFPEVYFCFNMNVEIKII